MQLLMIQPSGPTLMKMDMETILEMSLGKSLEMKIGLASIYSLQICRMLVLWNLVVLGRMNSMVAEIPMTMVMLMFSMPSLMM